MTLAPSLLHYLLSLMLLCALHSASAQGLVPVPPLTSPVVDIIGMLQPKQRATLETLLKEYEERTGSQIGVLLIDSTAPEALDQYGIRVADAWKLGRKGVDDGVILIVAKSNPSVLRRLRIETGRGVQGTLTDAQSKRIVEDVIAPHFRQNDFYGGLAAGLSAITTRLDQEHFPAPQSKPGAQQNASQRTFDFWMPLLFIGFITIAGVLSRGRRSRRILGGSNWEQAAGVILGSALGRSGFGGNSRDSGFSGGGGGFDGGGASGDW